MASEHGRLYEAREQNLPWRKWGPYLSERQWGTVREDYSHDGNAWGYFTHDQARSRAYHWGEDGLAGISDEKQLLCFSVGLWNGWTGLVAKLIELFGRLDATQVLETGKAAGFVRRQQAGPEQVAQRNSQTMNVQ